MRRYALHKELNAIFKDKILVSVRKSVSADLLWQLVASRSAGFRMACNMLMFDSAVVGAHTEAAYVITA